MWLHQNRNCSSDYGERMQRDRHTRSAPSPLLGEANPSPQGGGEPTECVASPDQNSGSDFSRSDSGNDARGSTPSCPGLAQRDPGPRGHAMNLARATLRGELLRRMHGQPFGMDISTSGNGGLLPPHAPRTCPLPAYQSDQPRRAGVDLGRGAHRVRRFTLLGYDKTSPGISCRL